VVVARVVNISSVGRVSFKSGEPVRLGPMKDSEHRLLRRIATGFLTGPAGRLTAFALDLGIASTRYWSRRLAGRETPW
jgi:hypothetical protein